VSFIGEDCARCVDSVTDGIYRRTVSINGKTGWMQVANNPEKSCLDVTISESMTSCIAQVIGAVKRLFDTDAHPHHISTHLGLLAIDNPGIRVPGSFDGFEAASRAILGQQVSLKAAATFATRFAEKFGEPVITPWPELNRSTPTAEAVANSSVDEIAALGFVRTRSNTLLELAKAVYSGRIHLDLTHDPESTMRELIKLPGIGEWTAQYFGMRALRWPDAFPHTDLALYKALGTRDPKLVLKMANEWRPWRAYAAMHLWKRWEGMGK
jgi:AraC family transcriptional regulator of adaptative response / DNA-3-methyladenine glycosylase II